MSGKERALLRDNTSAFSKGETKTLYRAVLLLLYRHRVTLMVDDDDATCDRCVSVLRSSRRSVYLVVVNQMFALLGGSAVVVDCLGKIGKLQKIEEQRQASKQAISSREHLWDPGRQLSYQSGRAMRRAFGPSSCSWVAQREPHTGPDPHVTSPAIPSLTVTHSPYKRSPSEQKRFPSSLPD